MGLLAPLYIAGFAAIALPILFHLIRKSPQGKVQFSSLMFLQPSPPRLTKRSRLSNLLLLLLRAAAFLLLALAFARPFLNHGPDLDLFRTSARRVAILLDVSASMKRADLWQQAVGKVDQVVAEAGPGDEVELLAFDAHARPVMSFKEWAGSDPAQRAALLRGRLNALAPTWLGTNLGEALATAAEEVSESPADSPAATQPANDSKVVRQIVLISDMQEGSHPETLQGRLWPKGVLLDVRAVALKEGNNAALSWVKQETEGESPAAPTRDLRVRVSNEEGTAEQFAVAWGNDRGSIAATAPATQAASQGAPAAGQAVAVTTGRSVIIAVKRPAGAAGLAADRLLLSGDNEPFDNVLYVAPPRAEHLTVLFAGADQPNDPNGLLYYLRSVWADTVLRKVAFTVRGAGQGLTAENLVGARLLVIARPLDETELQAARNYAEAGGEILLVMRDEATGKAAAPLLGLTAAAITEAPATNVYALIARVDLSNALFAPFAEARFADFTKIHFWKHRNVALGKADDLGIPATFDDGQPFLLEKGLGKGVVRAMTGGWDPGESQLALSTKFVPLMEGFLRQHEAVGGAQYSVGDPIAVNAGRAGERREILTPDGQRVELKEGAAAFDATDRPGIYHLLSGSGADAQDTPVAVNLPADESRTRPLAAEDLERWGARLGTGRVTAAEVSEERRLRATELENRQKLWRWLILGVLGLLALETVLAGRVARRTQKEQAIA